MVLSSDDPIQIIFQRETRDNHLYYPMPFNSLPTLQLQYPKNFKLNFYSQFPLL